MKTVSKVKKSHISKIKAEAQSNEAALIPSGERKSRARGNQVAKMDEQQSGEFQAEAFKVKLKAKIDQMQLPKNEEQVDDFENNNTIDQVNNAAKGDVVAAKRNVTGAIESSSKQEPSEANIAQRTAKALPDPKIGTKSIINTNKALPQKRGNTEIKAPLEKKYKSVEQDMQQNHITDEQLSKSNEPTFSSALNAKNEAKQNIDIASNKFRAAENSQLENAKVTTQNKANSNLDGMHQSRKNNLDGVIEKQKNAGVKNTNENKEAVDKLNEIYSNTKKDVDAQLSSLETDVTSIFDAGATAAKVAFESHVAQKMTAYKKKRYGKWYDVTGYGKRIGDAWSGLPKEVEAFFVSGRQVFLNILDSYISRIASLVASRLNSAKLRISKGRQEIATHLKGLPDTIKKSIKVAIDAIQVKFNDLEESVNQKEADLIDSLVTKYKETLEQVDARIEEMKADNEEILGLAKRALLAVIEVINNIRKTITEILSAAADIIMAIVADPIGFLSNLINGVSDGFTNFGSNILKHLQAGLMGWLTGALDGMAIKMPEDLFSIKGIFSLSSQILGFTWDKIRMVGVKVIGEPVVKALESGFELISILKNEGIAGLWEHIKEQFSDLKETVMDSITDMIQSQVVQAGIKWIMGLLSPAGAFIKAAMAIIDIVKFFIQRAAQIMELVQAFIEGVKAVASGSIQAVSSAIENALAKAVPVVIGFLAALLGLGGLAQKVTGIFKKIHARVEKGLITLWTKIKTLGANLLKKIGIGKKEKPIDRTDKLEDDEVGKVVHFNANGEDHELWIAFSNGKVEVIVASMNPRPVKQRLIEWKDKLDELPEDKKEKAILFIEKAEDLNKDTLEDAAWSYTTLKKAKEEKSDAAIKDAKEKDNKVESDEEKLKEVMLQLFKLFNIYPLDAESERLVEVLEKMENIKGAKGFAGSIKGSKIPSFRVGLITQANRAEHYYNLKLLLQIEKKEDGTRVDLVIKSSIGEDAKDLEGQIYVEVKNWTGFEKLDKEKQNARLESLELQLVKYLASGNKVQLEWKGKIPDSVKLLCNEDNLNINIKEI